MLSICFLLKSNVYAETATFYEGEYIDHIYMNKYDPSTDTVYYQTARFFRNSNTNEFAYCIEPLRFFEENSTYESTFDINSISSKQLDKIKKIAHFGYQYKNHTEPKWYAITQMMIWREANQQGDFYFTDTLNGNRIEPFQDEINEIESLIIDYDTLPLTGIHKGIEGEPFAILVGPIISNYHIESDNIRIIGNRIEVKGLKEGTYEFELIREEDHNNPTIFYQSNNSQTLMKTGDLPNKTALLQIEIVKSSLIIHKTDEETGNTPQGEASLDGAIYGIYKEKNNQLIEELEIINNEASIKDLGTSSYYIQEITPGEGYLLNEEKYPFTINKNEYEVTINTYNKVIKKNIKIIKKYGEENNLLPESNITFEIYNHNNELIDTKTTNENGEIDLTLVYGTYKFIQINTTDGYEKIDDFLLEVKDNEDETLEFIDYKVIVPNTYTKEKSLLQKFLELLLSILC
ncbi:MAG: Cys-Gln thioester bond-forming surface protein [Bacilli bacterium]|nr:Cys-Gln thioester bond-forming surface protein [Bacilli bacterium]